MTRKPNAASSAAERIRARLATDLAPGSPPEAPEAPAASDAAARQHFLGRVDDLAARHTIARIPIGHIAPELRPDLRQPRMIPLPEELVVNGDTPPRYRELVAELRALGQSLKERQIQP